MPRANQTTIDPPALLKSLFDAALAEADPARAVSAHLPPRPRGKTFVVGAGKASAVMARALEEAWEGPLNGLVVVPYGHAVQCHKTEIVEASHPVPDENGLDAARKMLALAQTAGADDLVVCLISGGGSALLPQPPDSVGLAAKQAVNRALLKSGATIHEMNCVRKHLSLIKGGRLAVAAAPARIVTLMISDVPGDDPATIASGPTIPDATTSAEAREIIARYGIHTPHEVMAWLESPESETPKPGDAAFDNAESLIVAAPQAALEAATRTCESAGVPAHILGDSIEGEARDVARVMAGITRQVAGRGQPVAGPCVLLSGGELTVTVRGNGRGGRNVEFLLALALALDGHPGIWALAADTDGVDGAEPVAGAIVTPDTLHRARTQGLNTRQMLQDNDAHTLFAALGDQIITGQTLTNVNDFRAIYISA